MSRLDRRWAGRSEGGQSPYRAIRLPPFRRTVLRDESGPPPLPGRVAPASPIRDWRGSPDRRASKLADRAAASADLFRQPVGQLAGRHGANVHTEIDQMPRCLPVVIRLGFIVQRGQTEQMYTAFF